MNLCNFDVSLFTKWLDQSDINVVSKSFQKNNCNPDIIWYQNHMPKWYQSDIKEISVSLV
jgi:hypothetical protein